MCYILKSEYISHQYFKTQAMKNNHFLTSLNGKGWHYLAVKILPVY